MHCFELIRMKKHRENGIKVKHVIENVEVINPTNNANAKLVHFKHHYLTYLCCTFLSLSSLNRGVPREEASPLHPDSLFYSN